MKYTHQKRPYMATCIQWNGNNVEDVKEMLEHTPRTTVEHRGVYLVLRTVELNAEGFDMLRISTLFHGDWVVQGENRKVKVYTDAVFWEKYEVVR